MKIVEAKCPKCGAQLKIDAAKETVSCEFCGAQLLIEEEGLHLLSGESEEVGYHFERGRQKAIREQLTVLNRWLTPILLVAVIILSVLLCKSVKNQKAGGAAAGNETVQPTVHVSLGRTKGNESTLSNGISDDDFTIQLDKGPYYYFDEDMLLIEMTNHSGQVVSVYANAIAYDEEGNAISAMDERSAPFADGETVLIPLTFPNVDSFYDVSCTYSYNVKSKSVLSSLEESHSISNHMLILSVKNTGEEPVYYSRADILYYDSNGKVISWRYSYFDNKTGSILSPGSTVTKQIEAPESFQDVRIILSGYP